MAWGIVRDPLTAPTLRRGATWPDARCIYIYRCPHTKKEIYQVEVSFGLILPLLALTVNFWLRVSYAGGLVRSYDTPRSSPLPRLEPGAEAKLARPNCGRKGSWTVRRMRVRAVSQIEGSTTCGVLTEACSRKDLGASFFATVFLGVPNFLPIIVTSDARATGDATVMVVGPLNAETAATPMAATRKRNMISARDGKERHYQRTEDK